MGSGSILGSLTHQVEKYFEKGRKTQGVLVIAVSFSTPDLTVEQSFTVSCHMIALSCTGFRAIPKIV